MGLVYLIIQIAHFFRYLLSHVLDLSIKWPQVRSPCLGDKFSSMHGQKGVVGFLESQENFPFTAGGIVPDIVINPHAFPTRQTPGQLLEAALGKGIALGGKTTYATPFTTPSVDVITEQLHRYILLLKYSEINGSI